MEEENQQAASEGINKEKTAPRGESQDMKKKGKKRKRKEKKHKECQEESEPVMRRRPMCKRNTGESGPGNSQASVH